MIGGVAESTSESGGIGVTDVDRIQDIRSRYFREGQSIRQIARDMGMSRRTVRRYIQSDGPWGYTLREPRLRPVADAIELIVREIIENDQRVRNKKQRHTARRIYVRLVEEHGYRGSERTVRRLVAAIKQEIGARSKEVFLPLEFGYGQTFEADWLEVVVEMDGRLVPVNVFAAQNCGPAGPRLSRPTPPPGRKRCSMVCGRHFTSGRVSLKSGASTTLVQWPGSSRGALSMAI